MRHHSSPQGEGFVWNTSVAAKRSKATFALTVIGKRLEPGEPAPAFSLDALAPGEALPREVTLAGGAGRVRLLHVVNSLDTPVCHVGAHRFEQAVNDLPPLVDVYTVSMDLPFAQARWRATEGVSHEALSSHWSEDFGRAYGCCFTSGGCCSAPCSSSTAGASSRTWSTSPTRWQSRTTTPRWRRRAPPPSQPNDARRALY